MTDPSDGNGDRAAADVDQLPGGEPSIDEAERVAANAELHTDAWEQTLEDLWTLEEEYEEQGWDTITTAAGHTGPVAPVHNKGYWGLTHIVPDSDAEAIEEAVEAGEFPTYDVYRELVQNRVFEVITYMDPGTETAILLATNFELRKATELVVHTRDVGYVNSIIRYLDGTVVAEVRHDEPEKFFPRYDEFETYAEDLRNEVTFFSDQDDEAE